MRHRLTVIERLTAVDRLTSINDCRKHHTLLKMKSYSVDYGYGMMQSHRRQSKL